MDQPTFAELEYPGRKRKTRRELFLERMDGLIPWERLEERIRPCYPQAGRGRRPYALAVLLRVHCVQLCYNLSDPGMEGLFEEINRHRHLKARGLRLREGSIVDASIIEAPSSTKNRAGVRDPEMHQAKKGKTWHFGLKVHSGVDAKTGMAHRMATTAANVNDVTEAHRLLHGDEVRVWGDAGYKGVHKRGEHRARKMEWHVAMRPGGETVALQLPCNRR